jgi:hypothetical protein
MRCATAASAGWSTVVENFWAFPRTRHNQNTHGVDEAAQEHNNSFSFWKLAIAD